MVRSPKKKPTRNYSSKANKEIRNLQRSTDLLIRKAPFYRLVKGSEFNNALLRMNVELESLGIIKRP